MQRPPTQQQNPSPPAVPPAILYYSERCVNCKRLIDAIERMPSVHKNMRFLNIDTTSPETKQQLTAVPTMQLQNGQMLVGSKAFEYLQQFNSEIEYETLPIANGGSLPFSQVGSDGSSWQVSEAWWSSFSPLPN